MADDPDMLREVRNLLRRQDAQATAKPNSQMNALIREAARRAKAEAAGLAAADDPKRPTKAEIEAIRAQLLAEDPNANVGSGRSPSSLTRVQPRSTVASTSRILEHRNI